MQPDLTRKLLALAQLPEFKASGTDVILRDAAQTIERGGSSIYLSFDLHMLTGIVQLPESDIRTLFEASRALQRK